jgi:small-conductance mechanosensitive channel
MMSAASAFSTLGSNSAGALDEQIDAVALVHRRYREQVLALQLQPLPARDQEQRPFDRAKLGDRLHDRRQKVLGVVEQKQQSLPDQAGCETGADRQAGLVTKL